jgi:hypothetical protein
MTLYERHTTPPRDWVLDNPARVWWPGLARYRDLSTKRGHGYRTEAQAIARRYAILIRYARTHATGPELRVVPRW